MGWRGTREQWEFHRWGSAAPQCILWIGTSVCRGTTIGPLEHEVTIGSAVNFPCTLSGLPPLVGLSSVDLGYPLIIDDCLSEMSC